MTSFDTPDPGINPLWYALRDTGLVPVRTQVQLPNFSLPWLQAEGGRVIVGDGPLPQQTLRPWAEKGNFSVDSQVLVLHLWFVGCTPCHAAAKELDRRIVENDLPAGVGAMQIVWQPNSPQEVALEMQSLGLRGRVFLDLDSAVVERLGVRESPSTFVIDEAGVVIGYRMGLVPFHTEAFSGLLSLLGNHMAQRDRSATLHQVLLEPERGQMSRETVVKYLNLSISLVVALCVLGGVCYSWLRKNRNEA